MKKFALIALATFPAVAFAQNLGNLETLLRSIGRLVGIALPIVVAVALLVFFWGLVRFIFSASGEDAHKEGQRLMIWGLVALFVMVAVWGLIRCLGSPAGGNPDSAPQAVPTVPGL